jgi:PhnB protein
MANVKPIPEGYHSVTPYLVVKGAAKAIDFYKKALNATEIFRMEGPGGTIAHSELQIGDSRIMLADENPQMGYTAPPPGTRSAVGLMVYLENVDKVARQATDAGMKTERAVADQFYGDRSGNFIDPFGHLWTLSTHVEDVSEEEMGRRMQAMSKSA